MLFDCNNQVLQPQTLRAAFYRYCAEGPAGPAAIAAGAESLSREQILVQVTAAAAHLYAAGVRQADRIILSLQTDLSFFRWFWAAQLLGAVPVPVPAFLSRRRKASQLQQLQRLISIVHPRALIVGERSVLERADIETTQLIQASAAPETHTVAALPQVPISPNDRALIQFSSGSTSDPKGCLLSQRAVCKNARAWIESFNYQPGESTLNWMPLFHDFGLMVGVLAPVFGRMKSILMRTESFVAEPAAWFGALSAAGPVHTAAPASALGLVNMRLAARTRRDFQLHAVRSLICAAEPLDLQTTSQFIGLTRSYGMDSSAFFTAYGMSEVTVLASAKRGLSIETTYCQQGPGVGASIEAHPSGTGACTFISLGGPARGVEFQIADSAGAPLPARRVGHVMLRSESLMDAYLRAADSEELPLVNGWLPTGDIGYLSGGEFYFVSRHKDLIVIAGTKIVPAEIDHAVSTALGLSSHRVASFGLPNSVGVETIVIIVETRTGRPAEVERVARLACFEQTGFQPSQVVTCPIGTIPRTSSGKTRRETLRGNFTRQLTQAAQSATG
jgi:acyl-CoA synthetase (AMP-forming)/AMP-acid ligase II